MGLGPWHLLLIAVTVFLLFGNRLPKVMKSLREGAITCRWCGRKMPLFAEGCPHCRRPRTPPM
jgi:predicted amidophosphoribosyltransferase